MKTFKYKIKYGGNNKYENDLNLETDELILDVDDFFSLSRKECVDSLENQYFRNAQVKICENDKYENINLFGIKWYSPKNIKQILRYAPNNSKVTIIFSLGSDGNEVIYLWNTVKVNCGENGEVLFLHEGNNLVKVNSYIEDGEHIIIPCENKNDVITGEMKSNCTINGKKCVKFNDNWIGTIEYLEVLEKTFNDII